MSDLADSFADQWLTPPYCPLTHQGEVDHKIELGEESNGGKQCQDKALSWLLVAGSSF